MSDNGIHLLALDGGGVRGLSSLIILQRLMDTVNPDAPPKPCDYFDMIGGTSTGGLIAIMLGRLQMTVDECIDAYIALSDKVFEKTSHRINIKGKLQGRFDSAELERSVKNLLVNRGLNEDVLLQDADSPCKVFVCTTSKQTGDTVCLTSYRSPRGATHLLDSVRIWQACRATSAATSFFDPIAIGPYGEEFVDGALGANNPVQALWNEAQDMWGDQLRGKVKCLVSIGTGVPDLKPLRDDVLGIWATLKELATETEKTAEKFRRDKSSLDDEGRYYRFNVDRGLEDIGLEESKKKKEIAAATGRYIVSQVVFKQINACANNIAGREHYGPYQAPFVQQKLFSEQKKCLQLFRLTSSDKDVTYEWYKDRVEDRVQGTCLWFLQHDHFQRWLAQKSGPLLVSADPGCGKSVLAKYLIDHELSQQSATICYYFFKDQDQNTACQALCALLHQLFSQKPFLIKHAMGPFDKEGPGLIQSKKSLWTILRNVVRDPQAGLIIIVLDALDECAESEFKDLIRNIKSQIRGNQLANAKLKFLLTSRPYEQILSEFRGLLDAFPYIRILGEEESETISQEVNRVIQYRVEQLARKQRLSDKIKSSLEERLLEIEHRTYLWVYLVFDYLNTGFDKTSKGVKAAIQTLPQNVNQAYERILNKSREDPIVQKVLSIILAARRPLTLSEMNVAVRIDDQLQSIHDLELEEEEAFKLRLRSWCGLFVSIHYNRVYFLHQTVREFLTYSPSPVAVSSGLRWHRFITTRDAHTVLAELCVFYLNSFNSNINLPINVKGASGHDNNAFLNYSAENWGFHFHEADIVDNATIVPLASGIYDSDSKSHSIWSKIYCETTLCLTPKYFTGLIVASYFGHNSIVKLLLEKGVDVMTKDNHGQTPLSLAAKGGHEAVARLLLEKGADVEAKDSLDWTPLSDSAWRGHEAVARLLLEKGADVEAKGDDGRTSLSLAAQGGHEAVARLLLDKAANVGAKDNVGRTPLSLAAEGGHEAVARLLLEKGADVEAKDNLGWTPLSYAAWFTVLIVASYFRPISYADVEAKDNLGWTPLSYAAWFTVLIVASYFRPISYADVEAKYDDGGTPLSRAAQRGHEAVARLLLEKGADVEAKDKPGRTPLSRAAQGGHEAVARLLLEKGADVEAKDNYGRTPLSSAAPGGHEAVARLLLEKGADVEAKDNYGRTPLSSAAPGGHEAVARLLLEKGADVEAKDNFDWTPLSLAALGGHEAVARLLFEKGADVEAKDNDGRTSLSLAAQVGHEAVARLLLEKGADVEAKDNDGRTPLSHAAQRGYEAVVKLLKSHGARS